LRIDSSSSILLLLFHPLSHILHTPYSILHPPFSICILLPDSELAIVELLGSVRGPYAFILFHRACRRLFFGRDALGRRSLLVGASESGHLYLSSVTLASSSDALCEVPALGIFSWPLDSSGGLLLHPWDLHEGTEALANVATLCGLAVTPLSALRSGMLSPPALPDMPSSTFAADFPAPVTPQQRLAAANLLALLQASVQRRVQLTTAGGRIAVLFSGGVDCATVAALADRCLPPDAQIDLLNVAFERPGIVTTSSMNLAKYHGTE